MGKAIGDLLPLAVGVALSPIPIIAVVLMLGTRRARVTGPAFAVGWVVGLTIVGVAVLVIAGGNAADDSGAPSSGSSTLKLVIGIAFLLMAGRAWRGRPKDGEAASTPKWMQAIDQFSAVKALGAGVVLSGVNPKNLALTAAAAASIAQAQVSSGEEAIALAVFILLGSVTILGPLATCFVMGARAKEILDGLNRFMAVHNAAIMTVLLLVLGAKLIGDATGGFSA